MHVKISSDICIAAQKHDVCGQFQPCRSAQTNNPTPDLTLTLTRTLAPTLWGAGPRSARGRQGQSCHTRIANEFYNGVFGTVRTEAYRRHIPPVLLVPDTSVSSVRHRTLRQLRYDINTGTGHFGKFGTTWIPVPLVPVQTFIPVPDTSVTSVHQCRHRTLR